MIKCGLPVVIDYEHLYDIEHRRRVAAEKVIKYTSKSGMSAIPWKDVYADWQSIIKEAPMNDNKYIIELLKVRSLSAGKAVEIIDTLLEIETIKKNIATPVKVSGGSHE